MEIHQLGVIAPIVLLSGLVILLIIASGGDLRRLRLAWRVLRDASLAERFQTVPAPSGLTPKRPSGEPLRFLAILQRQGRLLDFLLEDVHAYSDAQIGAAVRDIHRQCRAAVNEHLVLDPVLAHAEGSTVDVPAGFDPSTIRLTGNVTGSPPFRGTLQHHGWRVRDLKLPHIPEGQDDLVLMPAEVEVL
jgi:hypothetical protein